MAVPSSYTELTLAGFMHKTIEDLTKSLGFNEPTAGLLGPYEEAVNQTLIDYGTATISTITGLENIAKLRAIAKVQVWHLVLNVITGDYDFRTAVDSQFLRSQFFKQAQKRLDDAVEEARRYGAYAQSTYIVERSSIRSIHDPYEYVPADERLP